jgi:23S rRNA (uracil1939-C5)-methyltransferase/tRNA (uracil-5-)-methyltransferase
MKKEPKKFSAHPFAYHEEIEVEITTLTNLGEGLGRVVLDAGEARKDQASGVNSGEEKPSAAPTSWVIMVPFALPGERVLVRIWHNAPNFSRGDLVRVLRPSPERVEPRCSLFGACGGCQYQNINYDAQLAWKTRIVGELLQRLAGITNAKVNPCFRSPREFGYRSKITPHFELPKVWRQAEGAECQPFPIGFRASTMRILDIPNCPIATDAINAALPRVRSEVFANTARYKRGATLLLRDTAEGIVTDPRKTAIEVVEGLRLSFPAGEFFQNNPFILPAFVNYALEQAAGGSTIRFLLDAYCGSGLFALAGAKRFERVLGVEVSADAVRNATANAVANGLKNVRFAAGDATRIFADADTPPEETAVLMDPPRRGSDADFLGQLIAFRPRRVVYISCAPDTQMRDLKTLLANGYEISAIQPFDLFPQTRHIENVVTLVT